MPVPEQTPLVENGLQQTSQKVSPDLGMKPETMATTILASVKEQHIVYFSSASTGILLFPILLSIWVPVTMTHQRIRIR
uniref:Uncharacterized protein n=1 Tax=Monodelphis domestica TaxID=13616 RepID=A0A5F8H5L7_MONDO